MIRWAPNGVWRLGTYPYLISSMSVAYLCCKKLWLKSLFCKDLTFFSIFPNSFLSYGTMMHNLLTQLVLETNRHIWAYKRNSLEPLRGPLGAPGIGFSTFEGLNLNPFSSKIDESKNEFSLSAIGYFDNHQRPNQQPKQPHQGTKLLLNTTAFI